MACPFLITHGALSLGSGVRLTGATEVTTAHSPSGWEESTGSLLDKSSSNGYLQVMTEVHCWFRGEKFALLLVEQYLVYR